MSSVSKRGHRVELTDKEYDLLTSQLKNGNRHQRRRAMKLLEAEERRYQKQLSAQASRLGLMTS